jgi:hypothetical protein
MFRLALAFVLGLNIVSFANAQDANRDKVFITTQFCGPWEDVMNTPKKYKEGMLFSGNGTQFSASNGQLFQGGMFFFVNQETGSYSIINVYGDGMACMMQTGRDFKPYDGPQPWDKKKGDGL